MRKCMFSYKVKSFLIILWFLGIYIGYTRIMPYIEAKQREWRLEEMRRKRLEERRARTRDANRLGSASATQTSDQQGGEASDQSNCVVCLTNPREVILLDCGHVCLCMDCMEQLPNKSCPICRESYRSFAPCYIP
jgi:E3 ubiquitin-protein ligase MUL1